MTKTPNSYGSNFARCFTDWIQFELNPPGLLKNHKNFPRPFTRVVAERVLGVPPADDGPPRIQSPQVAAAPASSPTISRPSAA